jgi:TRAP-type C4-dicarboxylate transport system permease small subunit
MVIVMFAQVVLRYVFETGFPWTEELSRFTMIYLVFIGSIVLTHENSHISVTILDEALKGTALKVLKCVQYLITTIYCVLMVRIGFASLPIVKLQTSPNMRVTMDTIYAIIPICCAFMLVYTVHRTINLFRRRNEVEGSK